jgi:hypothetical protein
MSLFKYLDTLTPKVYILQLGDLVLAKVGYTSKDIKARIKAFKFSGQWTGKEGDIRLHAVFTTPSAKSVEDITMAILARDNIQKANDKNLGGGYTEWYICSPSKIQSAVAVAIQYLQDIEEDRVKRKYFHIRKN